MARTQVEKMLEALLRSEGLIAWIGGYAHGVTSKQDPYVILYPAGDHLEHKACRVYAHDFKKLPAFIPTGDVMPNTNANPTKTQAQDAGIYHECPRFKIVMHLGKETQTGREKRFSDVLWAPPGQPAKQPKTPTNGDGRPDEDNGYEPDLFDLSYANGIDVADPKNTAETAAFFAYQREHSGAPMNRSELRRWWKQHQGGAS